MPYMCRSPCPSGRRTIVIVTATILAFAIAFIQACGADDDSTNESRLHSAGSDANLTDGDSSSVNESCTAHVYVSNQDNERLKVSLFIDSELMVSKEISSNSEAKIDSYPLPCGQHDFKITWWDEDIKKSFEMNEVKEIAGETSVNLYTALYEEPEKFEISVKLINENPKELEAFLYVDENFEKSKEVGKETSSDLGTIKMEEGVHNLSVRWQDRDTKIEYEKMRKINVRRDEAVAFYAPQGVSFEAKENTGSYSATQSKNAYSGSRYKSASNTSNKGYTASTTDTNNSVEDRKNSRNDTGSGTSYARSNGSNGLDRSNESNGLKGSSSTTESKLLQETPEEESPYSIKEEGPGDVSQDSSLKLYIYSALVILAFYLILRR